MWESFEAACFKSFYNCQLSAEICTGIWVSRRWERLQAANWTRWSPQLHVYMLQLVLTVPEDKLNSLDYPQKLSSNERKLLSEVCQILKPFEDGTLEILEEKCVSGSLAVPLCISLKAQMKTKFQNLWQAFLAFFLEHWENRDMYLEVLARLICIWRKIYWT